MAALASDLQKKIRLRIPKHSVLDPNDDALADALLISSASPAKLVGTRLRGSEENMRSRSFLGCLSLTLIALSGCGLFDGGSSRQQSLLDDNTDDPADPACAELDEASCLARSDCEATYVGVGCACPDCAPGTDCPPCDCDPNPVEQFAGCVDRDPCEGLDEQTCVATEGCQPNYGVAPGPLGPCIENPDGTVDCPPCDDTSEYLGCSSAPVDPCNGLSEEECVSTDGCAPIYGAEDGRTDPGQPSDPND